MSSSDNDIGFKIFALIDGLKESMGQASSSIKEFAEEGKKQVESVGGAFENITSIFTKFSALLAGGLFFKEAIESTNEWTTEVVKLSKAFGITTEAASGLALALDSIQVTTEDYTGAAAKLDRQIKSNEAQVNLLGVSTRDANGNLLSQQQLMVNAIGALQGYKEGTDRNIAAQYLFGRGVGDLGNLMRLTNEVMKEGADDAEKFGLIVDNAAKEQMENYKKAVNDVGDSYRGMQVVIGNALIPVLTSLAETFTSNSVALRAVEIMVKSVGTAFIGLQTIAVAITNAIGGYFAELVIKFQTYTEQIAAYATLNFTKANEAARNGQELLDATMQEAKNKMDRDMNQLRDKVAQIWNINGRNDGVTSPAAEPEGKTIPKGFDDIINQKKEAEKKALQERVQLAQLAASTEMQLSKISTESRKQDLEAQLAAGMITKQEELAQLKTLLDQENAMQLAALRQQLQTKGLTVVETQKINDQIKILEAKHEAEVTQIKRQSVAAQMAEYSKIFGAIRSSFSGMITGILQGTQTWQQAMANAFTNILSSFVGMLGDMLMNWIEKQIMMAIFGEAIAGAGARTTVAGHAAEAGAAAYAAISAIPMVGPFLAPGAAAAAYAGAMTYQMLIPAAKQGFDIPKGVNPLTQLHEEEMVLPAPLANAVRDMAGGGGSGGGSPNVTIHLNAIDARSGADFLKANAGTIAKAIQGQMRNANPALTGLKGGA